jgi:hypothetical protein
LSQTSVAHTLQLMSSASPGVQTSCSHVEEPQVVSPQTLATSVTQAVLHEVEQHFGRVAQISATQGSHVAVSSVPVVHRSCAHVVEPPPVPDDELLALDEVAPVLDVLPALDDATLELDDAPLVLDDVPLVLDALLALDDAPLVLDAVLELLPVEAPPLVDAALVLEDVTSRSPPAPDGDPPAPIDPPSAPSSPASSTIPSAQPATKANAKTAIQERAVMTHLGKL